MFKKLTKVASRKHSKSAQTQEECLNWLDYDDIAYVFQKLSDKIALNNPARLARGGPGPVKIVVSGGACVVVCLQTEREVTKDINFIADPDDVTRNAKGENVTDEVLTAKYAATKELNDYPPEWINADLVAHVYNLDGCETLFRDSVQRDQLMFRTPALEVYAADWRYQLVAKIRRAFQEKTRLDGEPRFRYDQAAFNHAVNTEIHLHDAVDILRFYIATRNNGHPLKFSTIRTWYHDGHLVKTVEVEYINYFYRCVCRNLGIEIDVLVN
ncbi:hypothetical protein BDZ97DRAFT_1762907 [Flammula alnicola]|nr:hypothetical protein BDZ97DRAFT_1762907 [Flammula alnicola]